MLRLSSTWIKVAVKYKGEPKPLQSRMSSGSCRFFSLDINITPIIRERQSGLECFHEVMPGRKVPIYLRDVLPLDTKSFYGCSVLVPRNPWAVSKSVYGSPRRERFIHPSLLGASQEPLKRYAFGYETKRASPPIVKQEKKISTTPCRMAAWVAVGAWLPSRSWRTMLSETKKFKKCNKTVRETNHT